MLFHLLEMFFRVSVFVPDAVCFNARRYPPSVMVLMRGQGKVFSERNENNDVSVKNNWQILGE
jgi:hypothetical protein